MPGLERMSEQAVMPCDVDVIDTVASYGRMVQSSFTLAAENMRLREVIEDLLSVAEYYAEGSHIMPVPEITSEINYLDYGYKKIGGDDARVMVEDGQFASKILENVQRVLKII